MVVGAYSMHLYCDCENPAHACDEFPHELAGETRAECLAQARRLGWVIQKDRQARCPKCRRKLAARARMFDADAPIKA